MSATTEYAHGDLVWAKLEGNPWWPGMICNSSKNLFKKIYKFGVHFHVQFFASPPTHAWIKLNHIKPFMGKEECKPGALMYSVKQTFWTAVSKAEKAQFMTLQERLKLVCRSKSKRRKEGKMSKNRKITQTESIFVIGTSKIPEQWQTPFVLVNRNDIPEGLTPAQSICLKDLEKQMEAIDEFAESEEEDFTDADDPMWFPHSKISTKSNTLELPLKPMKFDLKKMKILKEVTKSKPKTSSITSKREVSTSKCKSDRSRTSITKSSINFTPTCSQNTKSTPGTDTAPTGPEPAIGDFLLEKSECIDGKIPFLWKYKRYGLIQKYERMEEDGKVFYQNAIIFSDWWERFAHKYQKVQTKMIFRHKSIDRVCLLEEPTVASEDPELEPAQPVVLDTLITPNTSTADSSGKTQEQEISSTTSEPEVKVGEFVLDIKDKRNVDNFPIWKIENNIILKKYEAIIRGGKLLHKPVKTYRGYEDISKYYLPLKVKSVDENCVEVTGDTRPQLDVDISMEDEYEKSPLLRFFFVYMQVLLSHALEPGFLSEVKQSNDPTYMFPMGEIDKIVKQKTTNIERKIRWSNKMKSALHKCPYLREVHRPNDKRKCEALAESTEIVEAIVFLFGSAYDPETLQPKGNATHRCQEFKIGKTAIEHISTFHQLCHFKYNLFDKCLAKIKFVKETLGGDGEVEKIMDSCLGNKAWVLQNFEDFMRLVELT